MKPGAYLRLRRVAAGLSIEDLALRMTTAPETPAHSRMLWLAAIEDGAAIVGLDVATAMTALAIEDVIEFDPAVLTALIAIDGGVDVPLPQICRGCGCSWQDACVDKDGCCTWREDDPTLCTSCPTDAGKVAA